MQKDRSSKMNIVILGAGAIGSLFGALLSEQNKVVLIGRTLHIKAIQKKGLTINGKTKLNVKISAEDTIDKVTLIPDLLILTVKAYDTELAINQAKHIIIDSTTVLSLQNGLDNIDKIKKIIHHKKIIAGITTHGALFSKPGVIRHTGFGETILGELNGKKSKRICDIADKFNEADIETKVSSDITKEIWIKGIVNSSINPLTSFFRCKNGYLLENPILENILASICRESTNIARSKGINLSDKSMIQKTKDVIRDTSDNYSSMLQSIRKGKKTEIDSINGKLVNIGKKHGVDTKLNEILVYLVSSISEHQQI